MWQSKRHNATAASPAFGHLTPLNSLLCLPLHACTYIYGYEQVNTLACLTGSRVCFLTRTRCARSSPRSLRERTADLTACPGATAPLGATKLSWRTPAGLAPTRPPSPLELLTPDDSPLSFINSFRRHRSFELRVSRVLRLLLDENESNHLDSKA